MNALLVDTVQAEVSYCLKPGGGCQTVGKAWKTAPALAGDHIMGVGPSVDGGFTERMEQIGNSHPGSPLAARYGGTKTKSHKEIKTRNVLKKHKVI